MELSILKLFGEYQSFFVIGASASVIILLIWNSILQWRFSRLLKGASGVHLENQIASIVKEYEAFDSFKLQILEQIKQLDTRITGSVRGIGMVRFHPFAGSGASKPSFAAAFLAENGTGLLISTLHARESVSIFTKNIVNFATENELTDEEKEALEKAKKSLHT